MISDESVVLWELPLNLRVERKPLLCLLFIESLSVSEEGSGGRQMTSERLNKVFSTDKILKSPTMPYF